jgi:hypothetical protein
MPRSAESMRATAKRVRDLFTEVSAWGPPAIGAGPRIDLGRLPIHIALRPESDAIEPRSSETKEEARVRLDAIVGSWPATPRLAIEADTGLGKTTLAVQRCAEHVTGVPLAPKAILFVVHDRARVEEIMSMIRGEVARRGGDPEQVADLLGRQPVRFDKGEAWGRRFGCGNFPRVKRFGTRQRRVAEEVCTHCELRAECEQFGYVAHTAQAKRARVLVTTVAKLARLSDALWDKIGAVIGDEDILPGLLGEEFVLRRDLTRAIRYLRRVEKRERRGPRMTALHKMLPLLEGARDALLAHRGAATPALLDLLPDDCERFATDEGLREMTAALPRVRTRKADPPTYRYGERLPAPWERYDDTRTPRQAYGRFLGALMADIRAGDCAGAGTVRVVRVRGKKARIRISRFDHRTIRQLRERPLLLLDATMHPAVEGVLDVHRETIRYEQGRNVVQVLTTCMWKDELSEWVGGKLRLTWRGRRALAQAAAWIDGHHGYVFCRKSLKPLLEMEAARYLELRRTEFVTPKRERGWNARSEADAFVVLGRYAKDLGACLVEARALRSVVRQLNGTTDALATLKRRRGAEMFRGRGVPLRYHGELVERALAAVDDPLAAYLQDADRIATVRQFVGRDRVGASYVLLLRGDPTIGADALVAQADLAVATPVRAGADLGKAASA